MEDRRFRPCFRGCVEKDPRMARGLSQMLAAEFGGLSAMLYWSLLVEEEDPPLARRLEAVAREFLEHLRLLGRLQLALGGDPRLRLSLRSGALCPRGETASLEVLLREAVQVPESLAKEYEGLAEQCRDGVVRSVLECLGEEKRTLAADLRRNCGMR
ncbi:MAG: hypothetical protein IJX28_08165 [Clostridia bacterium]|nr:hypothetical protein [Clostridia bacterium]